MKYFKNIEASVIDLEFQHWKEIFVVAYLFSRQVLFFLGGGGGCGVIYFQI
jgi:hypothetical protein